jgi:hypothetical protein
MVFLLHGEDSFRIRLRANELVHSLWEADTERVATRLTRLSPVRRCIWPARLDARSSSPDDVIVAGQSQDRSRLPTRGGWSWLSTPRR